LRRNASGQEPSRNRGRVGAGLVGALRVGLGLAMAVRPEIVPRALGVDAVSARRMGWAVRMCAVRDAALGAGGVYAALTGTDVRPWLVAQACSDAGDAAAVGLALRDRQVSRVRAVALVVFALLGMVWGLGTARGAGPRGRGQRAAGRKRPTAL
jgi:hypothetical protein